MFGRVIGGMVRKSICGRVGSETKQNFGAFGERLGGKFSTTVLGEFVAYELKDRLPILAGIDFDAFAEASEIAHRGERFCFERVESQFHAFDVIVGSSGEGGTRQDPFFENLKWTFEIEHRRQFLVVVEDLLPSGQVR